MRHVVENREEAKDKGRAARQFLERNFSPEAVAKRLQKLVLGMEKRAARKAKQRNFA